MEKQVELFGFEIKKKSTTIEDENLPSFTAPTYDDGATVVAAASAVSSYIDLDGSVKTEAELVNKYREMSQNAEVIRAIDEIVNEAIVIDDNRKVVDIVMDDVEASDQIKKVVSKEFQGLLEILDFNNTAYEVFRRWYIDGRLYFHVVIDEKQPAEGIKELRYVDPRKIRRIREMKKTVDQETRAVLQTVQNEYFVYSDRGFASTNRSVTVAQSTPGVKIAKDSIIHVVSGINDSENTMVLSYLHPSIRPLNILRTMEDAVVIYRLARAPERKAWYIDCGNLPKAKAEQYMNEVKTKLRNKLEYNASTGEIRDNRRYMSMLDDYFLARREGGHGTEVKVLDGASNLGVMDDVQHMKQNFYQSLHVPLSRLQPDALTSIGRATEISREELNFAKFIDRLRAKFALLFTEALKRQLILKGMITDEEWSSTFKNKIWYRFNKDIYFEELKELEILANRYDVVMKATPFAGSYISHEYIRTKILRQTSEEISDEDAKISSEVDNPNYDVLNAKNAVQSGMDPNMFNPPPVPTLLPPDEEDDEDNVNSPATKKPAAKK